MAPSSDDRDAEGQGSRARDGASVTLSPRWVKIKLVLRLIVVICSLICVVTSLVWVAAAPTRSSALLAPLYGLPHPVLSIIWESIEIIIIIIRRDKTRGANPAAHVGCELILWMSGVTISMIWIVVTANQVEWLDSTANSGLSTLLQWADVTYFWAAMILATTICQFILFVLACTEVDRRRKKLEQQISHLMKVIDRAGGNPEEVLRAIASSNQDQKPSVPIEMPALNTEPVELIVEERPGEMMGAVPAWEVGVPPEDYGTGPKFMFPPQR